MDIRVPMIDGADSDVALTLEALERNEFIVVYEHVRTTADLKRALDTESWDAALYDHDSPGLRSPAALALLQAKNVDMPLIVMSGTVGAECAANIMRVGVADVIRASRPEQAGPGLDARIARRRRPAHGPERQGEAGNLGRPGGKYSRRHLSAHPAVEWHPRIPRPQQGHDRHFMNGLERMRARFPRVPTVVLSGNLSQSRIKEALNRAAAGYIPKTLGGRAMLSSLELVLAGETFVPSLAISENDGGTGPADANAPLTSLTPREREVLSHLIEGEANKGIAQALDIKEITVKVHLTKLFRKLNVSNRTQAVRVALDRGLTA